MISSLPMEIKHKRILKKLTLNQVNVYREAFWVKLNVEERETYLCRGLFSLTSKRIKESYELLRKQLIARKPSMVNSHSNDNHRDIVMVENTMNKETKYDITKDDPFSYFGVGDALSVILEYKLLSLSDIHRLSLVSLDFFCKLKPLKQALDDDVIKALSLYRCTVNMKYIDIFKYVKHMTLSLYSDNVHNVNAALEPLSSHCTLLSSLSIIGDLSENISTVLFAMSRNQQNLTSLQLILTRTKQNKGKASSIGNELERCHNIKYLEIDCIELRSEWNYNSSFLSPALLFNLHRLRIQYTHGTARDLLKNSSDKRETQKTLIFQFGPRNNKYHAVDYKDKSAKDIADAINKSIKMSKSNQGGKGRKDVVATMVALFTKFHVIGIQKQNEIKYLKND